MNQLNFTENELHKGNLILVNAANPLLSHQPELVYVPAKHSDILLERSAGTVLTHVLDNLNITGEIVPVSGYRSKMEQKQIYRDSLHENGTSFTKKYVALPDHSEHQTGLAIDLGLKKEAIDFLRPNFPYEGICNEFRRKALQYGFVERYQKGKEKITGIAHEPWHFRYVGFPHAELMDEQQLSLEEYIDLLREYPHDGDHLIWNKNRQQIEVFYLPFSEATNSHKPLPPHAIHQISGNNVDGFIITMWRDHP